MCTHIGTILDVVGILQLLEFLTNKGEGLLRNRPWAAGARAEVGESDLQSYSGKSIVLGDRVVTIELLDL